MKILFVCTGNTCRSPMAGAMAAEILGDDFEIKTAGLVAPSGAPATDHAITVMNERGLDLKYHKSHPITPELLRSSDLILTMTATHKAAILPTAPQKTYTLKEYAGLSVSGSPDVRDPFGSNIETYRICADEIFLLLTTISKRLKKGDGSSDGISGIAKFPKSDPLLKYAAKPVSTLQIIDHPLVESKLTMLRNVHTGNKEFRELVSEIATFICLEATRDAPLVNIKIETPVCPTTSRITERKYAVVPILRAGLGMVDGVINLLPTAKIGHIGLYRDPKTLQPVEYYSKLPHDAIDREILLLDPMIATGGTTNTAITYLKRHGITRIKVLALLVAPEGIAMLNEQHPNIKIFAAAKDERLNSHGYIVPGLGDAGDRLFGTK